MKILAWITEIENYKYHVREAIKDREDLQIFLDILIEVNGEEKGIESFIAIYEMFAKSDVKFLEAPMAELQKIYAFQNRNMPAKAISRKLDIDTITIYRWWRENGITREQNSGDPAQEKMF